MVCRNVKWQRDILATELLPGYDVAEPQWFDQSEPEIVSLKDV